MNISQQHCVPQFVQLICNEPIWGKVCMIIHLLRGVVPLGHTLTRLPTKFNLAFFYVIVEMFCISIAAPSALLIYSYEIFSMITSNTSVVLLCIQLAFRCSYQNLFTSHSVSELSTSYTQRMCYWLSFYSLSAIFVEISCPPIHLSTLCL